VTQTWSRSNCEGIDLDGSLKPYEPSIGTSFAIEIYGSRPLTAELVAAVSTVHLSISLSPLSFLEGWENLVCFHV
jgi:hypothetical protein